MYEDLVSLRKRVLSHIRAYLGKESVGKVLESYFSATAQYSCGELARLEQDGRLIAFMLPSRYYHRYYGNVITQYIMDYDPEYADQGIKFLKDILAKEKIKAGERYLIELYAPCQPLGEAISDSWHLAAVCQAGDVLHSLELAQEKAPDLITKEGMVLKKLEDLDEVEQIMALKLEAFSAQPELCWFWQCDQYQTQEFMRLMNSISKEESFVLCRDDKVLGYGGLALDPQNPYWGPCSGIDLVLSPEWRGKGIVYDLYVHLFQAMLDRSASLYKGSSHNPAVLKAGESLDRWPIYYQYLPK